MGDSGDENKLNKNNSNIKRKSYSIAEKIEAVKRAKMLKNLSEASRELNIDRKSLREWIHNEEKLMNMTEKHNRKRCDGGGNKRKYNNVFDEYGCGDSSDLKGNKTKKMEKFSSIKGNKSKFNKSKKICDASMVCEISLKCEDNDDIRNETIESNEFNESNERLKNALILTNKLMEILERYRSVLKNHKCFKGDDLNGDNDDDHEMFESIESDYNRIIENDIPNVIKSKSHTKSDTKCSNLKRSNESTVMKMSKIKKQKSNFNMSFDHTKTKQKPNDNDDIYVEVIDGETYDFTKYKRLKGEKSFICDWPECEYQNPRLTSFKGHIYSHYGVAPYKCDYPNCNCAYTTNKSLSTHKMLLHNSDPDPIVCTLPNCGRRFKHIMSYRVHIAKHNEPYTHCKFPGCEYKTKYPKSIRFKHHMATHTGEEFEKKHHCSWPGCEKSFHFVSELNEHGHSHSTETKYHCSWPGCDRRFKSKRGMELHQTSHSGEKNFVCHWPGCEFRTNLSSSLYNHKIIHTGIKKYVCTWPGCQSRFALDKGLKCHMMIHKGEKPHKCEWPGCDKRFVEIGNMRKHMFNIHRCRYYNANKKE